MGQEKRNRKSATPPEDTEHTANLASAPLGGKRNRLQRASRPPHETERQHDHEAIAQKIGSLTSFLTSLKK